MISKTMLALALAIGVASPARALDVGKAIGTATIDAIATPLTFAVETRKENLFDETKQDVVFVLTDKALGTTKPDDEIELSLRARRGELLVVVLRLHGGLPVNVMVSHKGLNGLVILPGQWFHYTAAKAGAGAIKLATHEFDGHSYAIDVAFAAAPYIASRQKVSTAPATKPAASAAPTPTSTPAPRSQTHNGTSDSRADATR